jgi:hypothetical protein
LIPFYHPIDSRWATEPVINIDLNLGKLYNAFNLF